MYEPRLDLGPVRDIHALRSEALAQIPFPCTGSFMVTFPFIPDVFADPVPLQLRLVGLLPSQQIVSHCDQPLADGATRFHLPLQTNPGCWSFHDGWWSQLEVGKIYQMDPSLPHGAVNWGETIRLHLLIDLPTP